MPSGADVGCVEPATRVATAWPSPKRLDHGTQGKRGRVRSDSTTARLEERDAQEWRGGGARCAEVAGIVCGCCAKSVGRGEGGPIRGTSGRMLLEVCI